MALTPNQELTLANGLRASTDPVVIAALAIRDDVTLTNWLNSAASPTILAWKENVPANDSDEAPDYSTFDSIVPGKRDSWGFFLRVPRDFSKNKVRKWVTDVWGNATAASNAEAILQTATEPLTNAQKILGQGNNATTGTVTATRRTFSGVLDITSVSVALNRNP